MIVHAACAYLLLLEGVQNCSMVRVRPALVDMVMEELLATLLPKNLHFTHLVLFRQANHLNHAVREVAQGMTNTLNHRYGLDAAINRFIPGTPEQIAWFTKSWTRIESAKNLSVLRKLLLL